MPHRTIAVDKPKNIPAAYRGKPIGRLLEYHNMKRPFEKYTQAQILVGMCMDSRKHLHIPDNLSFIIRTGGANLRQSEFRVSYAISVGGVRSIALIGHSNCGMVNLESRKHLFVEGLVKVGWKKADARDHFETNVAAHEIGSEADFILSEVKRLRRRYPKVAVAPMLYKTEDNRLYLLKDK